jgi:hypothetical protein
VNDSEMAMLVYGQRLTCERGVNSRKRRHGKWFSIGEENI